MTTSTHPVLQGLTLHDRDLVPALDPTQLLITAHAVQRYRERVERVPRWLALRRIRAICSTAAWTFRPRSWMTVVLHPSTVYGYGANRPDVCLLVRDGAVVTVLSRRFLAAEAAPTEPPLALPAQRIVRNHRSH